MLYAQTPAGVYTPISVGPDWLTSTAKFGSRGLMFEEIADRELQKEREAGGDILAASRYGFEGFAADHFFFGRRTDDVCIVLSGPRTPALAVEVITAATSVSRIDLQVSVFCHGEQPHLGVHGLHTMERHQKMTGKKGELKLTYVLPKGETLNVNKRIGDAHGRLYDYATKHKIGPERTVWRYEVEFKRKLAHRLANHFAACNFDSAGVKKYVHDWWSTRGLDPMYDAEACTNAFEGHIEPVKRDVLTWFEKSVSITVARAIKKHGLNRVLKALGLSYLIPANPHAKEDIVNGW